MIRMMELTGTHTVEDMRRAVETVAGNRRLRLIAGLTTGQAYNLYNEDPENYEKNLEGIAMKNIKNALNELKELADKVDEMICEENHPGYIKNTSYSMTVIVAELIDLMSREDTK